MPRYGALGFVFRLARAATLGSFHVLEQHVIVRSFPAGNLGTTESAGAFIFREMKRSVSLRLLQRGHTRQAAGTAVDEQKTSHKLLHGDVRLFIVLLHVLADDAADCGVPVVLEVEAPGARVDGGLLHLLFPQGGLVLGVVGQVGKEPVFALGRLADCTVEENHVAHGFAVHCSIVVMPNVFPHVQLSLGTETTNLAGVICPCVGEVHVNLGCIF